MKDRPSVAEVAREQGQSLDTVNTIAMDSTQHVVAAETTRTDGSESSGSMNTTGRTPAAPAKAGRTSQLG